MSVAPRGAPGFLPALALLIVLLICLASLAPAVEARAPVRQAEPQTDLRLVTRRKAQASRSVKQRVSKRRSARKSVRQAKRKSRARVTGRHKHYRPARPSTGRAFGLHSTRDPLKLRSSVAFVMNRMNEQVLLEKNGSAVLPIASITKLMTAMVTIDARLPAQQMIRITKDDVDRKLGTRSRLGIGTRLSRAELLQLALMSSENRAANALGRSYPGGMKAFVSAMNAKARLIGMFDTQFVEPTGLSSANVANARDLARLVSTAFDYDAIREYSTAAQLRVDTGYKVQTFRNTNALLSASDGWQIALQKTGYISEAGRCLVMHTSIGGMPVVMILLDSMGSKSRFGDARRIRRWIDTSNQAGLLGRTRL